MTGRQGSEQRFDTELRRAARALVTEDLPRGVLDPAVGAAAGAGATLGAAGTADGAAGAGRVRARRSLPGFAGLAAAVAVLLLATALAFGPGGPGGPGPSVTPRPSPTPAPSVPVALRSSAEIRTDFEQLGYTCRTGQPLASVVPGPSAVVRESVVCTPADTGVFTAAVIVGEAASGQVVEVHAKADFVGPDTPSGRAAVATGLAKAAAVVVRAGSGTAVGAWVESAIPPIEPDGGVKNQVDGYALKVGRTSDGGYQLFVSIAAAS